MSAQRSIRVLASVVAALAGLLFGLATPHASNEPVVGTWQGTFHCGNTGSAFTLTFEEGSGGLIEGEFRFSLPGASGATGAHRIRGPYTPGDRSFTVVPGDWIERPSGWRAAGISGSIHENGLTMTGAGRGCAGICDYVLGFQANSPFMQGRMEELLRAGSVSQGRFVQVDGGWLFTRIR